MLATADNMVYLATLRSTQIFADRQKLQIYQNRYAARVEKNRQNKTYHTKI